MMSSVVTGFLSGPTGPERTVPGHRQPELRALPLWSLGGDFSPPTEVSGHRSCLR